ncbi:hypothetical protein BJX99DRAFT_144209 [Aspergillus californicus]
MEVKYIDSESLYTKETHTSASAWLGFGRKTNDQHKRRSYPGHRRNWRNRRNGKDGKANRRLYCSKALCYICLSHSLGSVIFMNLASVSCYSIVFLHLYLLDKYHLFST